jgi:hypothetical protein
MAVFSNLMADNYSRIREHTSRMLKKSASKAAGEQEPEVCPLGRTVRRIRSTTSVRAAESVRRLGPH